jgi:hypothetical protein
LLCSKCEYFEVDSYLDDEEEVFTFYCHHPEYYIAVDIFKDITGIYPTSNPIHTYLGDMLWGDAISKTKSCPLPWCPHNLKFLHSAINSDFEYIIKEYRIEKEI